MLVLTRHAQQAIIIGNGDNPITVRVTEIRGGRIRLAIDAPREVAIRRGELVLGDEASQDVAPAAAH